MAGRPSLSRVLDVRMNGELVGKWTLRANAHRFEYADAWLASVNARALSLSLPLTHGTAPITGQIVENYFDNLLPDSLDIRKRLATRFGARSTRAFDLLERIGRYCVGAVQLMADGADPPRCAADTSRTAVVSGDRTVARRDGGGTGTGHRCRCAAHFTCRCAGEDRACAARRPVVPAARCDADDAYPEAADGAGGRSRAGFSSSVENEWLCSKLATAFGLPAADCWIERFGAHKVLVVERFDRRFLGTWWACLPQEDFCQSLGIASGLKYENQGGPGMSAIVDRLRGSSRAASDRDTFLASQLFFWLLAAPEGHAKNSSIFLEPGGGYRLTPLYDVLSAWPAIGQRPDMYQWQKVSMAMAVRAGNPHYRMSEIRRRHWNVMAKENAVGMNFEATIERFIKRAPQAIAAVQAQLPHDFPAQVNERIFEGIMRQVGALERRA